MVRHSCLACLALLGVAVSPSQQARAQTTPERWAPGPHVSAADDADLARTTRLATVLRLALTRNEDLSELEARTAATEARGRATGRLPDLELKYEQWGVPLARPLSLDRADTLMLGARQTFPAWGTLQARDRAAAEDAAGARDTQRARRQDIAAQVVRTFAAYSRADQELRLHLEHVGLTGRVIELAKLNQRTGHGGLQDVLRLEVELTRLHTDVARIEREQRGSRALLNALMNRSVDAPLGPPEDIAPPERNADPATLESQIDAHRAEVSSARHAVNRGEALLDDRRRSARIPSVMVGLDYWYLPMGTDTHHAYGAMVAINLPWFAGRHDDEQREAEQSLRADQHALASVRNVVRYQLRDAAARVDAARETFDIVDGDLLARARQSLEATQAVYASGQGDAIAVLDALRAYLQVRIERVEALADLASSQADLDRAAGTLVSEGGAP